MNKDCAIKLNPYFSYTEIQACNFLLFMSFMLGMSLISFQPPKSLRVHGRNQSQKCQAQYKCVKAFSPKRHSCRSKSHEICIFQLKILTQKQHLCIPEQFILDFSHLCWEACNTENSSQSAQFSKVFDSLLMKGCMVNTISSFISKEVVGFFQVNSQIVVSK